MAARTKYPEPHRQLLALATRARTEGLAFDAFWERARRPGRPPVTWATAEEDRPRGCVIWPRDTTDRNISIAATDGARDGWRRAYEGIRAPRKEEALNVLRPGLEALEAVSAERAELELAAA